MIDISSFTGAEYEYIRYHANFTDREMRLYELRNKQYTYEECAELMNMSVATVKRTMQKINSKIARMTH
jgi:DNA-binding CsgD family transcriptional regulator|nr:MAG TPA: ECF sigma factor [Caudoviricetes sp.]